MTTEELEALLAGDRQVATQLMREFGARLSDEVVSLVEPGIRSDSRGRRLVALVSAAIDLCQGGDTAAGLVFAKSLVTLLERTWRDLEAAVGAIVPSCCAHALNAVAHALFEEGAWDEALRWIPGMGASFPFIMDEPLGQNAIGTEARVLIRRNRLAEARTRLEDLPRQAHPNAPQIDLARRMLVQLEIGRFEVDRRPPIGEQAQRIWDGALGDQVRAVEAMRDSHAKRGLSRTRLRELDRIVVTAETMREIARQDLSFERKMNLLAPMAALWYDDLYFFSHPRLDPDHVNHAWIERRIHRTAMLVASETPDVALLDEVLTDLDKADTWCAIAGDTQGRWDALWNGVLLLERRAPERVAGRLARLCIDLEEARRLVPEPETRSKIASYFPGLAAKVCRIFEVSGDVGLVTTGCELRKGRALLASRAAGSATNRLAMYGGKARADLLGERTHYIGYTVLYHDDRIQAVLYTADGSVRSEIVDVRASDVRRRASPRQLDPRNWNHSMAAAPLRIAVAPLVAPLEQALRTGHIIEGDHVCVAAEDPIHLVPLSYLLFGDKPIVQFVSMSRCASFSDARAIFTAPVYRPEAAAALFVPVVSKALHEEKRRFDHVVSLLPSLPGGRPRVADRPLTAPDLLAELTPRHLIHIDAHGTFPDGGDPYRASGLVVSDGRGLPVRGAFDQRLLAPIDLIETAPDLTGSHVTLNACVSGRGLEGRGGDILGLEQALRLCGAASVIASHWDVPATLAATFMEGFYTRWPGTPATRASAWRTTILDMMTAAKTPTEEAECCVFGLFGDWR